MTLQIPEALIQGIPSFKLYNRSCVVTVGTVQVQRIGLQQGIDVWFHVRRSLKPKEPNTCDLKIWNLSDSDRKSIEQASEPLKTLSAAPGSTARVVPVKIEAGYVGHMSTIFLGELRDAQTVRDGPNDFVTEMTTGDGDDALVLSRVNASFPQGATALQVAQKLIDAMGCGQGNLPKVADLFRGSTIYQHGVMLKGNAFEKLRDLCFSLGVEVSIQSGKAQFLSTGRPFGGSAYELADDPNTGLTSDPSVDTKGVLTSGTLLLPDLEPGGPIVLNTDQVNGLFRIISIETRGDTAGNEWGHQIEAKRYGLAV